MNIKRVAVLGAGAVGSYVIWGLSNNKDITLGVIASGERNERLKKRGIMINGTQYTPEVWTPEEAKNVDLLIVSLKYGSLRGALDDIQTIVGENTTVMSLMNGVDSEEIISEKIDRSHILYSFIKVASQGKEDGYHFDPETTVGIYFGELEEPYESERVKAVNDIFENTGLHWIITDDIHPHPPRPPLPPGSYNKSQLHFPNKIHYLCDLRPIFSHNVNFPLKKVKY